MPDQRRARAASPVVGVNVKHIDIAEMKKGVIQHPVTDNFFVQGGDKAIAGNDFPPNKLPAFVFKLRDRSSEQSASMSFSTAGRIEIISRSMSIVLSRLLVLTIGVSLERPRKILSIFHNFGGELSVHLL